VRWDRLFDDLEAQLAEAADLDLDAEIADRTRRELATVTLVDRVRASVGRHLEIHADGAGTVRGELVRAGPDWLLLDDAGRSRVVAVAAVSAASGLADHLLAPAGEVAARLDLRYLLRGLARDRATVGVTTRDGMHRWGTIDRVGADHLDLAEHPADTQRRPADVRAVRAIALAGLAVVSAEPRR